MTDSSDQGPVAPQSSPPQQAKPNTTAVVALVAFLFCAPFFLVFGVVGIPIIVFGCLALTCQLGNSGRVRIVGLVFGLILYSNEDLSPNLPPVTSPATTRP